MTLKISLFVVLVFMIVIINSSCSREKQLSTSQKINDFECLYSSLKENYPFFEVNKRQNNVDWLTKKNEYLDKIKKTENDSTYFLVLKSIISELNSGHTSLSPTLYYDNYLAAYKKLSIESPGYKKWVEFLEIDSLKPKYWSKIQKSQNSETRGSADHTIPKPNYTDTIIDDRIGVMMIESFSLFNIQRDEPKISEFLESAKGLEALIIDIQDNGGGATAYWKENIVGKIISDPVVNVTYPIIKDGAINWSFYEDFFNEAEVLSGDKNFPEIPAELISERYYIKTTVDTIYPNNPIGFQGKIYLLVNEKVFSSSEGFAQFCKTTNWATVAGVQTGGDGIGSDPSMIRLPESGILLCYPSLIGLNHDGSLNSEERTIPDIELSGNTPEERLNELIRLISLNP
ncbi:MAG: S41 family peptidase [Proteiniphilum sp.]|jgi:hypothetical protein|uniref:S41 family peptidase n=1 Tax=Proteiniphilum sp. TaxID=1926877 RepID=UPI002B213EA6|nr:S41 family peptidase [Proteiniphilum sp.]MEA5127636.1 S41 family peptidase [Proteiniphilum sp.]